ncbi:MAG: TIR domain-containing protein [Microcoleaceae cyanobacterium MO_207.B10]|nr:TIR domain-containing protein [Microcoleaceae cyanobacterium MO_207.B10]
MNEFYNAFISYGRSDSKAFATKLYQNLTVANLKIWFDLEDIPLGVDFQNQIDYGIQRADNFIFIIAPSSIKSPYCLKEILQAVKYNKRIIPLLHIMPKTKEEWEKMHPDIGRINWIYFQETENDFQIALDQLLSVLKNQETYVKEHTKILVQALEWESHQKQHHYLLCGAERKAAEKWLKQKFFDEQAPCLPTDLHCEYICESIKNANNLMTQVFLSYATPDREIMEKIRSSIMREGLTVWTNETDIGYGKEFQEEIQKGVESADNVVYLISPESLTSEYCQKEIEYAFVNNKRLICLLIKATDLEEIPPRLRAIQFIDITENENPEKYEVGVSELLKELQQDAKYYEKHKVLLVKSLKWQRQNYNKSILLRGYNLQNYQAWLKIAETKKQYQPLKIQKEYIAESLQQPPESSTEVFISYSRADSDFARKINDALQIQGKSTWFDQESIASGTDFQQEIYRGIENSNNFLFIISPNSVTSKYCADEVEYAQQLHKRFITVLYKKTPTELIHPTLAKIQWINFNKDEQDFYSNFSELIRTLDIDREYVSNHTKWSERSREWEKKQKNDDLLLRGSEFALAEEWLKSAFAEKKQPTPTKLQQEYITKSEAAIVANIKKEKRQVLILKFWLILANIALSISIILGRTAFWQYRQAILNEVKATSKSSQALFALNKRLEALIEAIRAKKKLQKLGAENPVVDQTLRQAFYQALEYNRLSGHTNRVNYVTHSPDGTMLATASADHTIKIWDRNGELLETIEGHNREISVVKFSPDSTILVSASHDKTVKLWKTDGTLLQTIKGHEAIVTAVDLTADGTILASASNDKTVKLWKTDGTLLQTLSGHQAGVWGVAISPDNKFIATASDDKTVKLWKLDGTFVRTLSGHQAGVWGVAISPNGQVIATASADSTIKLWSPDGKLLQTLVGHQGEIWRVEFNTQGDRIASGSQDKTVKIWNLQGEELQSLVGHDGMVNSVSFAPDMKGIASASDDGTVKLWKENKALITTLSSHKSGVNSVEFSPGGTKIASGSSDQTVKIWELESGLSSTISKPNGTVSGIDFSPGGQLVATANSDNNIYIYQNDGILLKNIKAHNAELSTVQFSPDDSFLASGSWDNTAKLWELDGTLIGHLRGHQGVVWSVAISPNSQLIATASDDQTIKLWRRNGSLISTINAHQAAVYAVAFSPDGKMIASGSGDKTVKVWNLDGTLVATFNGHLDAVKSVVFSPDGEMIASGSEDTTVKVWNLDGSLISTLSGHFDRVNTIDFSPDGNLIVSGSEDHNVILWNLNQSVDLDMDQLLVYACDWVGDYLNTNVLVDQSDRHLCDRAGNSNSLK